MIRITQTEDLDLVEELHEAVFPKDAPPTDAELATSVWWKAEDDGYPVAFAGVCLPALGQPFMIRAGVRAEYRGLHLQRRLIRVRYNFVRRLKTSGWPFSYVWTYVAVANLASQRSLIACGFLPYWWEREDQTYIYFKRSL